MKHVVAIPLFRADRISEAREAEILSELRFSARADDYEANDYLRLDGWFRDGTILYIGFVVEAEDRHWAYGIACKQVELALEEIDRSVLEAA